MPSFPRFDPTNLDLSRLDLSGLDTERARALLRDAGYVAIGLGVLTFQQAQVRRRELAASLDRFLDESSVARQLGLSKDQVDRITSSITGTLGEQLDQLSGRLDTIEAKLDTAVEQLEAKLPEQAGAVVGQAHELAKAARSQVRGLLRGVA